MTPTGAWVLGRRDPETFPITRWWELECGVTPLAQGWDALLPGSSAPPRTPEEPRRSPAAGAMVARGFHVTVISLLVGLPLSRRAACNSPWLPPSDPTGYGLAVPPA